MKFRAVIHYEGICDLLVDAKDEDAAKAAAEERFDDIPDMELIANSANVSISVCSATDEEDEDDS